MIQSMTGYGRAEAALPGGKLLVEIRSLNGKNADIGIKTALMPKDKELEVRQRLASRLQRGTIDLFMTFEANAASSARPVNGEVLKAYLGQVTDAAREAGLAIYPTSDANAASIILNAVLRFPDVVSSKSADVIDEDNWPLVSDAIDNAIEAVLAYRLQEGEVLHRDVSAGINGILSIYDEVESMEGERIEGVKARLSSALETLGQKPDPQRFEQELIYYLDKLDINEERVRLRQNCRYFLDTLENDPAPGKKLGFIIQEIGREINTTGSKANHAGIQRAVVRMKDALEKVREQSMNIL